MTTEKDYSLRLAPDEEIIAVVPKRVSGPGWSNWPVVVYIVDSSERVRTEYIQPNEMPHDLHVLFDAGEAIYNALRAAVPVKKARKA